MRCSLQLCIHHTSSWFSRCASVLNPGQLTQLAIGRALIGQLQMLSWQYTDAVTQKNTEIPFKTFYFIVLNNFILCWSLSSVVSRLYCRAKQHFCPWPGHRGDFILFPRDIPKVIVSAELSALTDSVWHRADLSCYKAFGRSMDIWL